MNTLAYPAQFLSLRLSGDDTRLMERLHTRLQLSKTEVVKQALRLMAAQIDAQPQADAFSSGAHLFGRHGDAQRQATDIKSVVRERLAAKRARQVA